MKYIGSKYPVFDHNYGLERASARMEKLLPEAAFTQPIWEIRQKAFDFVLARDDLESDLDSRLNLFNQMFPPEMSLSAYANHHFARAHNAARPVESRDKYDTAAEPAMKLAVLQEIARDLILAAHVWLEAEGYDTGRARNTCRPLLPRTNSTLATAVWEVRNQEVHWRSSRPVNPPVVTTLVNIASSYPAAFSPHPPTSEPDLKNHSFAAEVCFDVFQWKAPGDLEAYLSQIT